MAGDCAFGFGELIGVIIFNPSDSKRFTTYKMIGPALVQKEKSEVKIEMQPICRHPAGARESPP
jgi:hypothetical protein